MSVYGIDLRKKKLSIVNEAYFGKSDTLLEIEKQIGVIREKCKNRYTDLDRSKEVQDINRLFEKQFGMDVFALHIDPGNTINAYTMAVSKRFDIALENKLPEMVEATQSGGYKFKKGNDLCIICTIYYGLLHEESLTDAEILALLLHEVGHNFSSAIDNTLYLANQSMMLDYYYYAIKKSIFSFILHCPQNLITYYELNNKHLRKKEKKTHQRKVIPFFKALKTKYNDFKDAIFKAIRYSLGDPEAEKKYRNAVLAQGQYNKTRASNGRRDEVFADKFATIYGYGPELASALLKMDKIPNKIKEVYMKLPWASQDKLDEFDIVFQDFYKFNEHPHEVQRLNEAIKSLKYELQKSNLDPKLTEAMMDQLKQLEKLRDDTTKTYDEASKSEQAKAAYYAMVNSEDPDAVDEDIEEEINKTFDEYLKK